jgi:hypothetical protein
MHFMSPPFVLPVPRVSFPLINRPVNVVEVKENATYKDFPMLDCVPRHEDVLRKGIIVFFFTVFMSSPSN